MQYRKLERIETEIKAMGYQAFIREGWYSNGEYVFVSAEHGDGAADYYGEFTKPMGIPHINPRLEKLAKREGCYWEWETPGCIYLAKA